MNQKKITRMERTNNITMMKMLKKEQVRNYDNKNFELRNNAFQA